MMTGAPECLITESDAATLTQAYKEVAKFYPNSVIDPKTLAWVNLIGVAGAMYGSKYVSYRNRKSKETRPLIRPTPMPAPQPQSNTSGPPQGTPGAGPQKLPYIPVPPRNDF